MTQNKKLKLGVFAFNLDGGFTATTAPERYQLSWDNVLDVARAADEGGLDALIPLGRWKGLGGKTDFQGKNYETLTWAAGLAASTKRINVFATVHAPVIHPIVAAKQCATIDHISGGRFGLNVVCGWNPAEFAMFGSPVMSADARYDYAREWVEIVRRLWTEEKPFDFEGAYFKAAGAISKPLPIARPHPPIMNAGRSPDGMRFAAQYADLAFQDVLEKDFDETRSRVAELRRIGREEFGREFEVWTSAWIICRPTTKEANEFYRHAIHDYGDFDALKGLPPSLIPSPETTPPEILKEIQHRALAGFGGAHMIGSPEEIAEKLKAFSDAGFDGTVMTFIDYQRDVRGFIKDVLPLLEQAGLRQPA
ncbi:LLM class flavin-dependent oxidoreductase [Hyphococcus luteus]|uniref:Luciferase-like domain-containing protein n=1 Tax=Hyphococcus luteus TaxID=2058213 RepID=A0A2S7K533_9PROT|nr:LLM class flavin-dependent oxidoreductase [Marinicaulis flavus]PQA87613.1 hypothetical protein CW354_11075 [Marinicaulis flavus]